MDKAEYKIATEQIKKLISQGEYAEASHIADTIDWNRVKSVMMLCTVSDLYKVNRRYEDAKELLYMAYERNPESRTILYSLCDLSIKLEEFVAAIEYYKAFVETAPRDTGRYVLQYRLYQAQDVSLEERIEVLEQLKREEYIEKWAYELAYLYHRIGFATKCVEECDELILWFGKGRYVYKAMELKMLHEPLTPSQQYVYDRRFEHLEQAKDMTRVLPRIDSGEAQMTDEGMVDVTDAPTVEIPQQYIEKELQEEVEEIQVKTLDVANAYNTLNLQKELAASLREILEVSQVESVAEAVKAETPDLGDTGSDYIDTAEMSRELSEEVAEEIVEEEFDQESVEEPAQEEILEEAEEEVCYTQEEENVVPAIWAEPATDTGAFDKDLIESGITKRIKTQTQDIFAAIEAEMKRDLFEVAIETEAAADMAKAVEEEKAPAEEVLEEDFEAATEELTVEEAEEIEEATPAEEVEEIEEATPAEEAEEIEEATPAEEVEEIEEATSVEAVEESTEATPVKETEEALDECHGVVVDLKRYAKFIRAVDTEVQIMNVLENANMKATAGNISVTGHDLGICFDFIKVLLTDLKKQRIVKSGKIAKISAVNLNKKEPSEIISKVQGGILIIERAGRLRRNIVEKMLESLVSDVSEILVIFTDTKQGMNRLFDKNELLYACFDLRVDIKDYTSDELIDHAAKYAIEQEYSIDEMGLLALRTRIEELISNDEALTLDDAEAIVDEAIESVNRKSLKHFMDILLHKRYDEEDRIILREQNFLE